MSETINAIKDTPVPTLLICAGLLCIFLGFITKLGGLVEVQPAQQKLAVPIGFALLTLGLVLWHSSDIQSNISDITDSPVLSDNVLSEESLAPPKQTEELNSSTQTTQSTSTSPGLANQEDLTSVQVAAKDPANIEPATTESLAQPLSLVSPIEFLENHYGEMQSIVAVDDRNSLENLYRIRYHNTFADKTPKDNYVNFWIGEVSSIDKIRVVSASNDNTEFKVTLCLQRNGSAQTLIFLNPLIQEESSWLIGPAKNQAKSQRGCNL